VFDKKTFYRTISKKGMSVIKLAETLNMHQSTLFRKVKGESEFTRAEMQDIRDALSISQTELDAIFFADRFA